MILRGHPVEGRHVVCACTNLRTATGNGKYTSRPAKSALKKTKKYNLCYGESWGIWFQKIEEHLVKMREIEGESPLVNHHQENPPRKQMKMNVELVR